MAVVAKPEEDWNLTPPAIVENHFGTSTLRVNLCTGVFSRSATILGGCRGSLVLERGPWPSILPATSAPEFGRGGMHEERRDLDSVDHSNPTISPGPAAGSGWSIGGSDAGCSGGSGAGSGCITSDATSSGDRSGVGGNACREASSGRRGSRLPRPSREIDRAS